MKRIAPNLTALVKEIMDANRSDVVADYPTAADELRALLAVTMESAKFLKNGEHIDCDPNWDCAPLHRAHARLDKVSK
jgi:hypothetical protein